MQLSSVNYRILIRATAERVWLVYSLLSFLVLAPLVRPGYILTLDMVFTPSLRMPTTSSNDYLFRVVLHLLHLLLPSDVIEKALLFAIVLLSGVNMHRLAQDVNGAGSAHRTIGTYVAGMFYMINPFTYDRFMAGQYEVLLGYALLPWFIRLLLQFLTAPDLRRVLHLVVCAVVVSIVSIHDVGLMAIVAASALVVRLWQQRADTRWCSSTLRLSMLALGVWIVSSSYWLVPLLLGKGSVATQIATIGTADQSAFATVGGSAIGKVGNIVRLQGFWAETRNLYELPQSHLPVWGLIGLIVWALVVTGGVSLWRARQRALVGVLALSAGVATLLAVGTLDGWLTTRVPLLAGYREPEKFVALVALTYATFIARGVATTLTYCRVQGGKVFSRVAAVAAVAIPLAWTSTMLNGFAGQLKPVEYPPDWSAVNTRLNNDPSNFQTLFLPWHLYMRFNFEGRIIASPATAFFDKPVIVSDNPEFRGAALSNTTPTKRILDRLLPQAEQADNFGAQLAVLHIKYVIVDHDDSYQDYTNLAHRSDMRLVLEGATLDLYRNEAYSGR